MTDFPLPIGFLLLPNFSLMGVTAGVDVLRHANRIARKSFFQWKIFTAENRPAAATNGLVISPDGPMDDATPLEFLFVCGGAQPEGYRNPQILTWLRKLARHGTAMGAITTGSYQLAKAGLLDGHACSTHWENAQQLAADFPHVEVRNSLYVIDRGRYTCSGATAALDMFLEIVARRLGPDVGPALAIGIAEQLQVDRIRRGGDQQALLHRTSLAAKSRPLGQAIALMEENLERPLRIPEIAEQVSLTRRQLQRLFQRHTDKGPADYYLQMRLSRARLMVTQSSDKILHIAIATGFGSHAHFTKCYRENYGRTPRADRQSQLP
ncbi:MAG: GlxA family transcriptional regulator [Pseudomonadota bacterium]